MTRQCTRPIVIDDDSTQTLEPIDLRSIADSVAEARISELVHRHPGSLPIAEIDPSFTNPVAICQELSTPAGFIDNLLVTPAGLPIIVECKLWRNPEGRRTVIGQIIDYAKELTRWTSSDLQREVIKKTGGNGNVILELVRAVAPNVDEIAFNDALALNLRKGRFLLLIVGDGIREGVEAITEYLQRHAGLHFSMGLVEMPLFGLPGGGILVTPRILARTTTVVRTVVEVPDGYAIREDGQPQNENAPDPERELKGERFKAFWEEFVNYLKIDDPEQQLPTPMRMANIHLALPAPGGACWLTIYRGNASKEGSVTLGVFLSAARDGPGDYALRRVVSDWDDIKHDLGGTTQLVDKGGRSTISDQREFTKLEMEEGKEEAFRWLAERVNTFVNVLRPRVRSAALDYDEFGGGQ